MAPSADRCSLEAHVLNQEIVRLDTMAKQRILAIESAVRDERSLQEETKHTKDLLASLRSKIESLDALIPRLLSRAVQSEVKANVGRHERELEENSRQLIKAIVAARKAITISGRSSLLSGGAEDVERRKRVNDQNSLKEKAAKTTERLSELVTRMNDRVTHSELTMDSLVHSSAVLAQTKTEFDNQSAHIQTGSKLLSKYERRELTDKILTKMEVDTPMESENSVDKKVVDIVLQVHNLSDLLRENKADEAKRLLTKMPILLESRDDSGRGPAHFAALGGCLPILQYAIHADAKVADEKDTLGWTPLMIACSAGRLEIVRYLLTLPKININARAASGQTPLIYAASKNHLEVAHLLLQNGAEANSSERFGATALHRAASQGHEKMVHLLLSSPKIHVDARDTEGNTALFLACDENREDVAIALAAKGADFDFKNREEKSPMDVVKNVTLRQKLRTASERRKAGSQ